MDIISQNIPILYRSGAPAGTDLGSLGTVWIDLVANTSYTLVDVTAGVATWAANASTADALLPSAAGVVEASKLIQVDASGNLNYSGGYISNDQTTTNMMSKGTVYRFDGANDYITVPHSTQLDPNGSDWGLHLQIYAEDFTPAWAGTLVGKIQDTNNRWQLDVNSNGTLKLFGRDAGTTIWDAQTDANPFTDGAWHTIDISVVHGTSILFYINGILQASTTTTLTSGLIANTGAFYISSFTTTPSPLASSMAGISVSNFAPTAAEVKDLISGNIPFKWQYGSQTAKLTEAMTANNLPFDLNPRVTASNDTVATELCTKVVIDGTASNNHYISDIVGTSYFVVGKRFKVLADIYIPSGQLFSQLATGIAIDSTSSTTVNARANFITPTPDAWQLQIELCDQIFTAASVGRDLMINMANSGSVVLNGDSSSYFAIKNINVIQLGAVALYDQTSISETYWYDKANGNDGAVTGAEVLNAPSVSPLLALHSEYIRIQPGGTPGTNINCTQLDGYAFNQSPLTDGVVGKSGTTGSFSLSADGKILTINVGKKVVGIISASLGVHDLNSSSVTELYTPQVYYTSGNISITMVKRGAAGTIDLTTILDSGDDTRIMLAYVTAT